MTFEIEYYNESKTLRTYLLFKLENQDYYIFHKGDNKWVLCENCLWGLLTLVYIPFSELLNYFTEKENSITYFPVNETIIYAMRRNFWQKQAIKNWLEDDKFILTEELKSTLLNQDLSRLDTDLQNRLLVLLSDNEI